MFEFDELEAVTLASFSRAGEPQCRGLPVVIRIMKSHGVLNNNSNNSDKIEYWGS